MTKRKLLNRLLHICVLALALSAFFGGLTSDNLISSFSPERMLSVALPALNGIQKSNTQEEKNDSAELHEEQDEDHRPIQFELLTAGDDVPNEIIYELLGTKGDGINLSGTDPTVLIYHTHTTEAYTQTKDNKYVESSNWRTLDYEKNIVKVGEELTTLLRDKYGIAAIHDTKNHEPPALGTSYTRSIITMENYLEKYPSIKLFIDVHRDAYTLKKGEENSDFVTIDGQRVAKLMFVVGTGEGRTGAGFSKKPHYKENYALARSVTERLQKMQPGLVRPIRLNPGRYNQHITGRALLVEVGHNANTLEEALASIPYLAKAIAQSVEIKPEEPSEMIPTPQSTAKK